MVPSPRILSLVLILSKNKLVEQIEFAVDLIETGSMAEKLVEVESEATLAFIATLSPLVEKRRRPAMMEILPGVYNIDRLADDGNMTEDQHAAIAIISPLKGELFLKNFI